MIVMATMATMASVCGPFPQPGHICHRVFTKINIVRAAASWAKVPVYYSNVGIGRDEELLHFTSLAINSNLAFFAIAFVT